MALKVAEEISWEEPPEVERTSNGGAQVSEEWKAVAELLASNPGAWARIAAAEKVEQARALAHRINKGRSRAFEPGGSYEAEARPDSNGGGGLVYARYVGEHVDPVKVLLEGNKVSTLKEMARDRGLKVSGSGKELATRIVAHDEEQLSLVD
jgi:hypothetical protein